MWRRRDPRSPKGIEKPASLEAGTPEACPVWRRRDPNPCGNKSLTWCWRMTSLPNQFAARMLLPSIESPGVLLSPLESTWVVETLWRRSAAGLGPPGSLAMSRHGRFRWDRCGGIEVEPMVSPVGSWAGGGGAGTRGFAHHPASPPKCRQPPGRGVGRLVRALWSER